MRSSNVSPARGRNRSLLLAFVVFGVTTGSLLTLWVRETPAELKGPVPSIRQAAEHRQVALMVSRLLRDEHILRRPLDDEIARRALTTFVKVNDPLKRYFYQSDIDEFTRRQDELDDMVKKGDISFAYAVVDRLLQRVDERMRMVDELLAMNHDFTVDEEMDVDIDNLRYPANEQEARERWRKQIKLDLLGLKADDELEGREAIEKLRRRYRSSARRRHQIDSDELLEMYLGAISTAFDPHTTYMSPNSYENFGIMMRLALEGIGAALKPEDGHTLVVQIVPGGAADKHGKLKPEDRIVSVGQGKEGEMIDVVDMKLNDVVKMIRGKAGTVVRLGVIPAGETATETYEITRAKIELKDSEARGVIIDDFPEGAKAAGTAAKIGVINLPGFYMDMAGASEDLANFKSASRDMRRILDDFKRNGVEAVVVDLRRNGGGSLKEAINTTGLFIDRGPVVQVKDYDGRVHRLDDLQPGMAWDGPLIVLTSKLSASASEIFAGAIQDYRRGLIVGDEATHGKGTVQSLLDLGGKLFTVRVRNLGALKITIQKYYRPSGHSTQKRGVLADVILPAVTAHLDIGEADLDYAIDFDQVRPSSYNKYDMSDAAMLNELKTRSAARRGASKEFQKIVEDIEHYREQKARKKISLNEVKYLADRAKLGRDKAEEKLREEERSQNPPVFKKGTYNDEVLAITLDYIRLLGKNRIAQSN